VSSGIIKAIRSNEKIDAVIVKAGRLVLEAPRTLSAALRESWVKLMVEHPGLNSRVAEEAVRGSAKVVGKGIEGADVILVNGVKREVSVQTGSLSNLRSRLLDEAVQLGEGRGGEIFMQINTPGATQEKILQLLQGTNGLRSQGIEELVGRRIRLFGPDGKQWFDGVFH
jgi:hypothetical protein